MPHFLQHDITWNPTKRFQWDRYTCAVRCTAMALTALVDEDIDMKTLERDLRTTENGTTFDNVARVLREHGCSATYRRTTPRISTLAAALDAGHLPIITIILPNGDGHAVILKEIDDDNELDVIDPSIKASFERAVLKKTMPLGFGYVLAMSK